MAQYRWTERQPIRIEIRSISASKCVAMLASISGSNHNHATLPPHQLFIPLASCAEIIPWLKAASVAIEADSSTKDAGNKFDIR
jgi:hypothetical protein